MTICLYCHNKHCKEELEAKDAEIAALRAVLKECHNNVYQHKELAALVDFYYHEFFVEDKHD